MSVNLVLSFALSAIGLRQYEVDHRTHPEYFYHGNVYYMPPAQSAMYCINMPAYALSAAFAEFGIRHVNSQSRVFTAHSFFYVYDGFFVAVLGFWWWLGTALDNRGGSASARTMPRRGKYTKTAAYVISVLASLYLAYDGLLSFNVIALPHSMALSKIVWGVLLFAVFLALLLNSGLAQL